MPYLNTEMTDKQKLLSNLVFDFGKGRGFTEDMREEELRLASEEYVIRSDADESFPYFAIWYDSRWDGTKEGVKEFGLDPEHKVFDLL